MTSDPCETCSGTREDMRLPCTFCAVLQEWQSEAMRAWQDHGQAPRGLCPWCGAVASVVQRDGWFRARCSVRMCGASGPRMRKIERAVELFSAGKNVLPKEYRK